jgi:hypothetical protein
VDFVEQPHVLDRDHRLIGKRPASRGQSTPKSCHAKHSPQRLTAWLGVSDTFLGLNFNIGNIAVETTLV